MPADDVPVPPAATTSAGAVAPGRRERKKLATRQVIADQGLALFLERGYEAVTIAEIAEAADVAVSTVFTHFPSKEAVAFARDPALEAGLVAAVMGRAPGVSIVRALRDLFVDSPELVAGSAEFVALVRATPALTAYSDRMWSRHAHALALAIERETGHDPGEIRVRAWTRYVVQIPSLVRDAADRAEAVDAVFALLADGWNPEGPAS